jgi:DNA polymerase-1
LKPNRIDAYNLFHEGALALAEVEANGMRVDVAQLERTTREVSDQLAALEAEQRQDSIWRTWQRRFGSEASMGSRTQLAKVLFEELGYESKRKTKTGRAKVDKESLEGLDVPFVKRHVQVERLKKLRGTYLNGISREVVDGFVHASINEHLVQTYRSSCDSPNLQNQIVRDAETAALLRRCFISRDGCVLTECDYGAQEWRIAACFWRDENMVAYASDSDKDVHRDMAAECYMLPVNQVPKQVRFYAKNQFVFPQLYGSDYIACSRNLWNVIGSAGLETTDGVHLGEHLSENGIKILGKLDRRTPPGKGTFERHVLKVENRFKARFPQWAERKEQWWEKYKKQGWFNLLTGFRCTGVYTYNELMNYPIQGPAFHCLLWSLIRLQREMKKRRMRSVIVMQIHDSILADVYKEELDDYFELASRIMSEDIRQEWPWIIVPLLVECEVATPTWYDKVPYKVK